MTKTAEAVISGAAMETRRQKTLRRAVSYSGIGIHTGKEVTIRFCPSDKGTGIIFRRTDLPSEPLIPATVEYVRDTERCTTLGIGSAEIHTVEHVLAALASYEVDNLIIELDGPEPPVGDGSSSPFVKMIEQGGVEEQEAQRPVLGLKEPIFLSKGPVHIIGLPADEYRISYTLHYPAVSTIGSQFYSLVIDRDRFKRELSECRTFALYGELKMLMDAGLIKGGSLDNAVVIHEEAIFSKEGLKFPNEMVRHKILDVVGDLALVGFSFRAHIVAICSGHTLNVAFAKKLLNHVTMEKK